MVSLLRGAQSGDAESFTCLYDATNPLLVRYLRVVSDADPAPLAVDTWSRLVDGISLCAAGDDDDWLELAVSTAREQASAATSSGTVAATAPDQLDEAIAALRACGPDVAEVLAMGVVAGLGRDSIARITGHEPTEVLALVLAGQARLGRPLAALSATFGAPATAAEVRDLPVVLPLFTAQAHEPPPPATTSTASPALGLLAGSATAAALAGTATAAASAGTATAGTVLAGAARPPGAVVGVSPRLARVGAGAAAWTFAVGGVAAAAALIGVAPAAFDSLFGNGGAGSQGIVAAHGPTRTGGVPSFAPGGAGTTPPASGQQTGQLGQTGQPGQTGQQPVTQGPGVAGTGTSGTTNAPSTGGGVVSASTAGLVGRTQVLVVSAVLTSPPPTPPTAATTPTTPATPTAPGGILSAPPPASAGPTPAPPSSSPGSGTTIVSSAVKATNTAHPKHSSGLSKGRAKAAEAAAARARAKAAAAKARAAAAAAHAKAKAARSKA